MAQQATYTITAYAASTGYIYPSSAAGVITVNSKGNQTFIIGPSLGYTVQSVPVDYINQLPIPTATANVFQYTFSKVTANHQIYVNFVSTSTAGLPQITGQPQSITVPPGATTARFAVTASGNYQWYESTNSGASFSAIPGASSTSYTVPASATTLFNNGTEYVCEITNSVGIVSTNPATLTISASAANPYVKVNGRQLEADFTGNGNYHPYIIRGVDYSPTPIGRYSSDWTYYASATNTNPDNLPNNMLADDANILNRDFYNLQQMNANTIRIWQGDNTQETSADLHPGRFPNMITTTTLDRANFYGLKVIAGFYVGPFGSCNYANPTQKCTYTLNTYNGESNNPAFNAANSYDITNPVISNDILTRFETYVSTFKNRPEILFWAIGNENNYSLDPNNEAYATAQIKAWYSLVNHMAAAAHAIEGTNYHPVAVVNGEIEFIGEKGIADDSTLPNVDIWGINTYRGESFYDLFAQYKALSTKPLWISEYGIVAWKSCNTYLTSCDPNNPYNTSGTQQLASVLPTQKANDESDQASWDGGLWDEIAGNGDITIGGSLMEYSDEWWKPYDWICSPSTIPNQINPYSSYAVPNGNASYCQSNHFYFGEGYGSNWPPQSSVNPNAPIPPEPDPGYYDNEAWFGIMGISNSYPQTQPDIMTPRQAVITLECKFFSLGVTLPPNLKSVCQSVSTDTSLASYLASPVQGKNLSSTNITFTWSLGIGVTKYQLLAGRTQGASDIYSYTGNATSTTVSVLPLTGNNIYIRLESLINGAWNFTDYTYSTAAIPTAPIITSQPLSTTVIAPASATFTVSASGTPLLTYQWFRAINTLGPWKSINGATQPSYTIPVTSAGDNLGKFECHVMNSVGTATSQVATLNVNYLPIITQPSNQTVAVGARAFFMVSASGVPAPSFQWYKKLNGQSNWSAIGRATQATYTTPEVTFADNLSQFECKVTNSVGTVTSNAAKLMIS